MQIIDLSLKISFGLGFKWYTILFSASGNFQLCLGLNLGFYIQNFPVLKLIGQVSNLLSRIICWKYTNYFKLKRIESFFLLLTLLLHYNFVQSAYWKMHDCILFRIKIQFLTFYF